MGWVGGEGGARVKQGLERFFMCVLTGVGGRVCGSANIVMAGKAAAEGHHISFVYFFKVRRRRRRLERCVQG